MESRQKALDQVVAVARDYGFSADEFAAALEASNGSQEKRSTNLLGRILGTLGGIFVFAGLGVFIAMNWDAMNTAARIVITLGSGIAALAMALVASKDDRGQRFKTPLYLMAALLQPTGILVALNEFSSGGDWRYAALVTAGIMALQQGLVFRVRREAVLLFTTIFFSLWLLATALDLLGADSDFIALLLGGCTVGLCGGLDRTSWSGITPFWYFVGSAAFLSGLFSLLRGSGIELLFLVAACGGVYLSIAVRSRVLLIVSTVAILAYISYFTSEHFLDSLGWPIVLILLGLLLIGLSAAAMRINRRYIARAAE